MDSYSSFMELEWATYIHVHMGSVHLLLQSLPGSLAFVSACTA